MKAGVHSEKLLIIFQPYYLEYLSLSFQRTVILQTQLYDFKKQSSS